jgi:hypothetical protein
MEEITPETFKTSLERSLRWQSESSLVPVFENLVGFQEFRKGALGVSGIRADGNTLIFEFTKPFRTGLLEYLAMAPFGFLANENFKPDGSWADETKFISSGPYKLSHFSKTSRVTLEKRQKWYKTNEDSAERIEFSDKQLVRNTNALYIIPIEGTFDISDDLTKMNRVPEDIYPIVLLPKKDGFFQNAEARNFFKSKILEKLEKRQLPPGQVLKSEFFYPHQNAHTELPLNTPLAVPKPSKPLVFRGNPLKQKHPIKIFVSTLLIETLEELKWPYKIEESPVTSLEDYFSTEMDISTMGSEVGGGLESWIAQMLFCSTIGPRYPDVNGKICSLTEKYEAGLIQMDEFIKNFNDYVASDSSVIPILHTGKTWYASKSINVDKISPVVSIPRFEDIEVE